MEIATTALKDADTVLGFVHVLQDRTEQLMAEERVRLAQDVGRVGTFELLPGEARLLVSSGFCELWGLPVSRSYSLDELVRQLHPDDVASLRTLTARRTTTPSTISNTASAGPTPARSAGSVAAAS